MWSMPRLHKESTARFGSWKLISSARGLQKKGASQRGQEPLDKEAEDATLLEAATKQRSEDCD
jgi:formamidopyrimidine-DNA glycosylase